MTEENERVTRVELGRWLVLGLLLLACLVAYFLYAPRVRPLIQPAAAVEEAP